MRAQLAAPAWDGRNGLASPLAGPSHLERITWEGLFDGFEDWRDALPMTRAEAMSVPEVARARNVLAGTAGRLPLRVHDQAGRPVAGTVLAQPEPGRPALVTLTWAVDALLFYGRAWWVITSRDNAGLPLAVEWVPEWSADLTDDGVLIGHIDGRRFDEFDVIRIDGPHEGVLATGTPTIRQAVRLQRAALRVADNPVPAINLHHEGAGRLTPDEIDNLIDSWVKARRGDNGGVAYTNSAINAQVLGLNPEQLLIEGRRMAALQVARALGVPAWVIDAPVEGSALTYSNTPSRSRELVDYGLSPYLAAIESRLSMGDVLPDGQWARFDVDELLRADFGDRMSAYKTAREAGVYTVDELREREHGRPVTSEEITR